jgi:phosphatidylinositol glycan class V
VSQKAPESPSRDLGIEIETVQTIFQVALVFVAWKTLLLITAYASPGPGYDTSSQLLPFFEPSQIVQDNGASLSTLRRVAHRLTLRLTRWDAVYFASAADRGLVFEQEWAFSPFLAAMTSNLTRRASPFPSRLRQPFKIELYVISNKCLFDHLSVVINTTVSSFSSRNVSNTAPESFVTVVVTGVVISHVAHLVAVGLLFGICYAILPTSRLRARKIAFTAAILHIVSPAGLFLSAPYGESLYAALTFAGVWSHATAFLALGAQDSYLLGPSKTADASFSLRSAFFLILSSVCFGLGSLIRGNGLLNGLVFVFDIVPYVYCLPTVIRRRDIQSLLTTVSIGLAGVLLGLIYASGQIEPYLRHCTSGNDRPWCSAFPPSIYTFVQRHYWNNGFLRYWTLSNLPLFLLAAPMLLVMLISSYLALFQSEILARVVQSSEHEAPPSAEIVKPTADIVREIQTSHRQQEYRFRRILASLALPQLAFTVLAFTSFHVQIVNRVSSGYALWYMTLAIALHSTGHASLSSEESPTKRRPSEQATVSIHDRTIRAFMAPRTVRNLVRGMVMYAIIQGGLYASFLPPA